MILGVHSKVREDAKIICKIIHTLLLFAARWGCKKDNISLEEPTCPIVVYGDRRKGKSRHK